MLMSIVYKQIITCLFAFIILKIFCKQIKGQWRMIVFLPFFICSFMIKTIPIQIQSDQVLFQSTVINRVIDTEVINQVIHATNSTLISNYEFCWLVGVVITVIVRAMVYFHFLSKRNCHLIKKNKYDFYVSSQIISPCSMGIVKKKIILPQSFSSLTSSEQEIIIQHEILHIKLNHLEILTLMNLIQTIYWFNPVVYLTSRLLREQMEYCVDEKMNENQTIPFQKMYCECLLKLSGNQMVNQLSFSNKKSVVYKRIISLVEEKHMKKISKVLILVSIILLTACSSIEISKIKQSNFTSPINQESKVSDEKFIKAKEWLITEALKTNVDHESDEEKLCIHPRGTFVGQKSGKIEFWSMPHPPYYYEVHLIDKGENQVIYFPFDNDLIQNLKENVKQFGLKEVE